MTLTLRHDTSHPGGGFARLEGSALAGVTAITIENGFAPGQYLGEDGKWGRTPFAFPVEENTPGVLTLGPHIVDHVPTELQVELRSGEGRALGQLFWADVIPSRNPGSVTTRDVLEDRRRRAEQRAADEATALEKAAQEQVAREAAVREAARVAARATAQAEEDAARQREADRARNAASAAIIPDLAAEPVAAPPRRRSRWLVLTALLLLPLAAAAAFVATRPDLLDALRRQEPRQLSTVPPQPTTPPSDRPSEPETGLQPYAAPTPAPEPPKPLDCSSFAGRVGSLRGRSDADKVALGEDALHAGCGVEAFQAFDTADTRTNEAAAWNLARFYDPNETDPVYRRAASVHPDFAAVYYRQWRDRSPRQAQALAKICEYQSGSASLRKSCER